MLRFDAQLALPFVEESALSILQNELLAAHDKVLTKSGVGSTALGWRDLLIDIDDKLIEDLVSVATDIQEKADVLVCIGIGGSYLGAKAVIQALQPYFTQTSGTEVIFAGHHMSGRYLNELMAHLEGKSVFLNVISKSGTTLEPALAFRFLRRWLEERFGDADSRTIVTTDTELGALNELQRDRKFKKFIIPSDVGGRFSVLTPVGLLPIAAAGIDIGTLIKGAASACIQLSDTKDNDALLYAGLRYLMLKKRYAVEIFATFEPNLAGIGSWWQQLFGESEGKNHTGLYPDSVHYSTDLHSLGQYIQDGQRNIIETFMMSEEDDGRLSVPTMETNLDGLDYLIDKPMSYINRMAYEGTAKAHYDGGVPNMSLWLDRISPGTIGECIYFFEHAVAVSGYLIGINPFDQPGVENYKKEMFCRLGKP